MVSKIVSEFAKEIGRKLARSSKTPLDPYVSGLDFLGFRKLRSSPPGREQRTGGIPQACRLASFSG